MKSKTLKSKTLKLRGNNVGAIIEQMRRTRRPFVVCRTGYTTTIQEGKRWNERSKYDARYYFAEEAVNTRTFAAFNALKRDAIAAGGLSLPPADPVYYNFSGLVAPLPSVAYSVDLTSAYAQALYNLGLCTTKTLGLLRSLPKVDRLRAVGMLATARSFVHFDGTRVTRAYVTHSETRNIFLVACEEVGRVMGYAVEIPGFLCFWVDGAFFRHEATEVADTFEGMGYPCKIERLDGMRLSSSKRFLFFGKDGERKYLTLPQGKRPAPQWINDLLNAER